MKTNKDEKYELRRLITPHISSLNKIAMLLCRDRDKAEDLVAETLLKVCENIHRLKDKLKFKSWVFRILNNTFISNYRNEKNMNLISLDENVLSSKNIDTNTLGTWGSNPEKYLINKLLDEDIRKNINLLPEEFRMTVILCDIENLSYKEISVITRVPVGTVRSRLSRGRSILQKKLHHAAKEMGRVSKKKSSKEEVCICN
jgi:RNA polymerase sigma-70 factor (ECF subfamily)